jgi:hypothetical protein
MPQLVARPARRCGLAHHARWTSDLVTVRTRCYADHADPEGWPRDPYRLSPVRRATAAHHRRRGAGLGGGWPPHPPGHHWKLANRCGRPRMRSSVRIITTVAISDAPFMASDDTTMTIEYVAELLVQDGDVRVRIMFRRPTFSVAVIGHGVTYFYLPDGTWLSSPLDEHEVRNYAGVGSVAYTEGAGQSWHTLAHELRSDGETEQLSMRNASFDIESFTLTPPNIGLVLGAVNMLISSGGVSFPFGHPDEFDTSRVNGPMTLTVWRHADSHYPLRVVVSGTRDGRFITIDATIDYNPSDVVIDLPA